MSYLDDAVAQTEVFEGCSPTLYLDTRAYVTVAVGRMLPNVAAAQALPFQTNAGPATQDQIRADYERVCKMQPGHGIDFYKTPESLWLEAAAIDNLLRGIVASIDVQLRHAYPQYSSWPDAAKGVVIDMAFNLGVRGLIPPHYPRLNRALLAQDWATAAQECHRDGPSMVRNNWARDQFRAISSDQQGGSIATANARAS